jgi:hypothetical protein
MFAAQQHTLLLGLLSPVFLTLIPYSCKAAAQHAQLLFMHQLQLALPAP